MLNASAVVPRAFACSKYVRARVTREEALLEEKRKDGREREEFLSRTSERPFEGERRENKISRKRGVKLNIVLFFDPTLNPKRYEPLRQYYSQQH